MTEVLFYQLDGRPLEKALPQLLEKSLERGWRAVVQATSPERVAALDAALWTYRDESFLPHGTGADGNAELQPVYLTDGDDNPNGAEVRFLVDGAEARGVEGYRRVVCLFDGGDEEARAAARAAWRQMQAEGHDVTYWQQDEAGRWQKKG